MSFEGLSALTQHPFWVLENIYTKAKVTIQTDHDPRLM